MHTIESNFSFVLRWAVYIYCIYIIGGTRHLWHPHTYDVLGCYANRLTATCNATSLLPRLAQSLSCSFCCFQSKMIPVPCNSLVWGVSYCHGCYLKVNKLLLKALEVMWEFRRWESWRDRWIRLNNDLVVQHWPLYWLDLTKSHLCMHVCWYACLHLFTHGY